MSGINSTFEFYTELLKRVDRYLDALTKGAEAPVEETYARNILERVRKVKTYMDQGDWVRKSDLDVALMPLPEDAHPLVPTRGGEPVIAGAVEGTPLTAEPTAEGPSPFSFCDRCKHTFAQHDGHTIATGSLPHHHCSKCECPEFVPRPAPRAEAAGPMADEEREGWCAQVLATAAEKDAEIAALRADLARISEELGLPPSIGPAPGELRRIIKRAEEAESDRDRRR